MEPGSHDLHPSIGWEGRRVGARSDLQHWQEKLDLQIYGVLLNLVVSRSTRQFDFARHTMELDAAISIVKIETNDYLCNQLLKQCHASQAESSHW
jgi:hypothetical protein